MGSDRFIFIISLLSGLAVIGGFILFIIPGIIFSIWFCLSEFVFVSDGLRDVAALKRSKQLVEGYWWPVFGRILIIILISILVSELKFLGFIINMFVINPISLCTIFLIYKDLKKIKG